MIPFTTKDPEVTWKVQNISAHDHFIAHDEDFMKIYKKLPDCPEMKKYYNDLLKDFRKLKREGSASKEQHAKQVNKKLKKQKW